ncbi:DNA binding domain-containing protein, excisionase family [Draconibacterium orientale]|uniref:DNA binding domain-containing protein, excisionase family n=1 Tax=Draconibacterium orientale TaxID=1168034 RepID=X5E338_9BACT|nr:helix-turn-helix domain-containing protein [Draconibacterium orientale]AHW61036.1 DNA-binding protein [Draconibacterium orientale]SET55509.1 DNA binding domain-containing protein, excisionase family [Draconibacterium orientale]
MSSKIEIQKICEYCGKEFTAKTTVTRFCGHTCAARSYKQREKDDKIGLSNQHTNNQKLFSLTELDQELIKQKDFLSIKETSSLIGVSERTIFRLLKNGTLQATKIGSRSIIHRSEINKLFAL